MKPSRGPSRKRANRPRYPNSIGLDISANLYLPAGYDEGGFEKVSSEDKTLTLIPGASHIEACWKPEYVDAEKAALVEFFGRTLK